MRTVLIALAGVVLFAAALLVVAPTGRAATRVERQGTIGAWWATADGRIRLRIDEAPPEDGRKEPRRTWFVTRPSTSGTIDFEQNVLLILLEVRATQDEAAEFVIVHGEASGSDNGRSPEHAIDLESIGLE